MCGINGVFAYHYAANPIDREELIRTRDHMSARGPDGYGAWVSGDERIGFGHRRLAILDLSDAGAQPMVNDDGSLIVTFNGEIYNYRLLRRDLEAKGYVFHSASDTEVLLHLYADRGEAMVHELRGMFAFAIWDAKRREVFLARDPYGIKPLYYADDGWTFRFASQVKALLAGGKVSKDPEPAGVVGFHLFGSVPEPFTTYLAVRALPAGCTLKVDRIGAASPVRYHSIASVLLQGENEVDHDPASVRDALLDSVHHHLVSDVPVGAFLSAGIDSGALVGLMREAGQAKIKTITLSFAEFRATSQDEAPLAEEVARRYGTEHVTRVVDQREFEADYPRILEAMDQPTIDGVNAWFVAKAAREAGLKVAISGLGGDELLGGYPSFQDIPRWVQLLRPFRFAPIKKMSRASATRLTSPLGLHPKFAGLLEYGASYPGAYLLRRGLYMPWEMEAVLGRDMATRGLERLKPLSLIAEALKPEPRDPAAKVTAMESAIYMRNQLLRDADWASMAHSLEVRVPLVDAELLRCCARVRGLSKAMLADAPALKLPETLLNRAKTGFGTPILDWTASAKGLTAEHRSGRTRNYLRLVAQASIPSLVA